jgi:hypothetical protein
LPTTLVDLKQSELCTSSCGERAKTVHWLQWVWNLFFILEKNKLRMCTTVACRGDNLGLLSISNFIVISDFACFVTYYNFFLKLSYQTDACRLLVLYCLESFCNVLLVIYNDKFYIHFGGSLEYWINEWMNEVLRQVCLCHY